MSYNPFAGIASASKFKISGDWASFVYIDEQLKNFAAPEVQGIPLTQILLQSGWTIDAAGVLTPPAPKLEYALMCTDTPGATAILPTQMYIDAGVLNLLMSVRFDDPDMESVMLYRRKTQAGTILEFGINDDDELYVTVESATVVYPWSEYTGDYGQWHDIGFQMNDSGGVFFYVDGRTTDLQTLTPFTQTFVGENLIDVGGAGVSIAWLALRLDGSWGMFDAEGKYGLPMPHRMPAGAINCYNFALANGVIPDLAIRETYKCSLGVQSNASIVEVQML